MIQCHVREMFVIMKRLRKNKSPVTIVSYLYESKLHQKIKFDLFVLHYLA